MKTSRPVFLVGFVAIIFLVSAGYSLDASVRVRGLERRLQHAEALLQSHARLEQRVQSIEKKSKPHVELLAPYFPER